MRLIWEMDLVNIIMATCKHKIPIFNSFLSLVLVLEFRDVQLLADRGPGPPVTTGLVLYNLYHFSKLKINHYPKIN